MPSVRSTPRTRNRKAVAAPTLPGWESAPAETPERGAAAAEAQELVRVEKSLQSIGFFAAGKTTRQNGEASSRTVTQVVKQPDGRRIQARAVITAPGELGLPTTADRDKYMALMKLLMDRRSREGLVTNPVRFSGYQLLRLLRLSLAGYHYDEINDWLKRMTATTIMSESIVFLADRKEYVSDIFHVFDQVTLYGHERADGGRAEEYEVHLSRWQLQNINSGFLLQMDLNAYLELRRDIAKTLFGHLHVWFFASRGRTVEKEYRDFCALLHIQVWPHLSKIRQILEPSMKELIGVGYLSGWDVARGAEPGSFKIMLSPGPRLLAAPAFAEVARRMAITASEPPGWVAELIERGVNESAARQMALDIAEDQPVADQIDYADAIIARGKLRNPPGLYVSFLRDNIAVPADFETRSRRRRREQRQRETELQRLAELDLEAAWETHKQELVAAHVAAQYTPVEVNKIVREKVKHIKKSYPSLAAGELTSIARGMFLQEVARQIAVPSLEAFGRQRRQGELFAAETL